MTIIGCIEPAITPGSVQFSAAEFLGLYPQFTPQASFLQANFNIAAIQLDNTCTSKVQDAPTRQTLLYLLTAHITQLLNGVGSTPPSGLVGRLADGTEGSVSASTEWDAKGGPGQAYYLQTQFGAQYWQLTAKFRTARYHAPRRHYDDFFGGGDNWGGGCGC